jgi:hypothetical protein
MMSVAYRGSGSCIGRSTFEMRTPSLSISSSVIDVGHHRREVELPALRHGHLPFMENAGVILGLLVVVGQRVAILIVVILLWRRRRLPCSTTRRWLLKREVPVAEEACLPSRIIIGLVLAAPVVGVDGEGGIVAEGRRRYLPPAPDLAQRLRIPV